ncbi:unnamed protein product, partial [Didymodactylos carnosus]
MYHENPSAEAVSVAMPSSTTIKKSQMAFRTLIPVYLPKRGGATVAVQANQKKREIRGKREYSDHPKTNCTPQEQEATATQ